MSTAVHPELSIYKQRFAPQLMTDSLLWLVATALFVITQSLLRTGEVTPASIDQWLLGLIPVAIIYALAFFQSKSARGFARTASTVWIIALCLLILVNALYLSNAIQTLFFEYTNYHFSTMIDLAQSLIIASVATFIVAGAKFLFRISQRAIEMDLNSTRRLNSTSAAQFIRLTQIFCLVAILYFVFVYRGVV